MEKRTWKGAIFDLDGTLLDSMGVWREIDKKFLKKRGFTVPTDYMEAISAMNFPKAARYTISRFGLDETPEMLIEEWKGMAKDAYANEVGLKPGVRSYLKQLKKEGILIAAATSGERSLFIPCLKRNGIYEYFDALVTAHEVKRGKGFPDIYELAAERIGVLPKDCMVFEDIYAGVSGAKMGEFLVTGILDDSSSYEWNKIRACADRTIVDFMELQ